MIGNTNRELHFYRVLAASSRHSSRKITHMEPGTDPHEPELSPNRGDARRVGGRLRLPELGTNAVGLFLIAAGLALMVYSYFVSSLFWLMVVGIVLAVAPYAWKHSSERFWFHEVGASCQRSLRASPHSSRRQINSKSV